MCLKCATCVHVAKNMMCVCEHVCVCVCGREEGGEDCLGVSVGAGVCVCVCTCLCIHIHLYIHVFQLSSMPVVNPVL
jgi:hypothetical protein